MNLAAIVRVITFSSVDESADVYAYDIKKSGMTRILLFVCRDIPTSLPANPGLFNVQNALAAISVCYLYGIPAECMYVGLMKARSSGRMEVYSNADSEIIVIVDYAHNKMSFETLFFDSVKKGISRKTHFDSFWLSREKALGRRHDLGITAGKFADKVYITEEDFGEEPL